MRIGIISDTHLPSYVRHLDELGPEPVEFLSNVDLILHSGDLTTPTVLDWLEQFAPVLCSTGNNDPIPDPRSQDVQMLDVEGWRIGMVHDLVPEARPVAQLQQRFPDPPDIMIAGHTHEERLEYRDGAVILNSGSITFPWHKELRLGTVGLLELSPGQLHAEVIIIGNTPGRPNPCRGIVLDIKDGVLLSP